MKKKFLMIMFAVLLFIPPYIIAKQKPDLPKKYKKWIEEEVVHIATSAERDVINKLESDEEREQFIELFWKQRDPTPGTPRNEFKEEHYRRIEYANKKFKRFSSLKGWQTDRGRIYIILGKPIHIEKYLNTTEVYPIEIWTYYGNPALKQASIFRLLFVRKFGVGPFELYNPLADGPKSLTPLSSMRLPSQFPDEGISDRAKTPSRRRSIPPDWVQKVKDPQDIAAYEILRDNVSFEVAAASFSNFPGREGPDFMLPSTILISDVQTYPQKKVQDDYAYDFLEHEAIVEVDYSVNYISCHYMIQVYEDKPGLFFVNYCLEPETLSVDSYEDKYFTNVRMTIRVTDIEGRTVLQHMRNYPVEIKKKQLEKIGQNPFHLYDSFPLVSGSYKINLLYENMVTKEFTSIERNVVIPEPEAFQMSSLLLTSRVDKDSPHAHVNKAFQIGKIQIYPMLRYSFSKNQPAFIFFQVYGLTNELKKLGNLEFSFFKGEQKVKTITKEIVEYGGGRDILMEFSFKQFPPGKYKIEVSVINSTREKVLSNWTDFTVVETPLPTSWIMSQPNPPSDNPVYDYLLGIQYMNKKEYEKAKIKLDAACSSNPQSMDFALNYARVLLLLKEYSQARKALLNFLGSKENFDLLFYLGKASQFLGEYKEAITYFQKSISHKGNIVVALNSTGECYIQLGDKDQALAAFEKSLEVNPNQEKIKKAVETLKEKK